MEKNKVFGGLALLGVVLIILGNIIKNETFWIFADIYAGALFLVLGYWFLKAKNG